MIRGKLRFFSPERGYGFATRDDGQPDAFVHVTQLEGPPYELSVGDVVEFDMAPGRDGRMQAANVRVASSARDTRRMAKTVGLGA